MKSNCSFLFLLVTAFLCPTAKAAEVRPPSPDLVAEFKLPPFYKKALVVEGLPVLASEKVSDFALQEAAYLIGRMLAHRPEILPAMAKNKVRFSIMAPDEFTTDIPEHSDLMPKDFWDRRARGLGATPQRPSVSCGEENLLCYSGDPYSTENILIHEFGHAIHHMGLNVVDPTFDRRLRETYALAMKEELWKTKYAAQNYSEYWAEGVQSWFDTNRVNDHDHNHVHTRSQIREYDPRLARLLEEVFGDRAWRYQKPQNREPEGRKHLAGYDAAKAPRFVWPERLANANRENRREPPPESFGPRLPLLKGKDETPASGRSELHSVILFENKTKQELDLFWVDAGKNRKPYGKIRPGERLEMSTYSTHVFELCDETGKRVAAVVAGEKAGRAEIE